MDTRICPACNAPGLNSDRQGGLRCDYCGSGWLLQPIRCPVCGWENPRRSDACTNCGEPLTMIGRVLTRQGTAGPPAWLGRVRSRAGGLKEQGALASEQRMEQLLDIDRRRQADDARALARRRASDRQLVLALGLGLGVLVLVIATVVVLTARGS